MFKKSIYIDEGFRLLSGIKGKKLSFVERKRKALNLAALLFKEVSKVNKDRADIEGNILTRVHDLNSKAFIMDLIDRSFRSRYHKKAAEEITYLLEKYDLPSTFPASYKIRLLGLKFFGQTFPGFFVPLLVRALRRDTFKAVWPAESNLLTKRLLDKKNRGMRVNLLHIGEGALGYEGAKKWISLYLDHISKPELNYITVKLSAIFPLQDLVLSEKLIQRSSAPLREIFRAAQKFGKERAKFIMLDMEESSNFDLVLSTFKKVLDEDEFLNFSAGLTLQSYLPFSYPAQKELIEWAKRRVKKGGAPIKILYVKGAYLLKEQALASKNRWAQPTYLSKMETDSNFKRMLLHAMEKENLAVAKIGIGTHNIFDIAFALVLKAENQIEEDDLDFEMLEGALESVTEVVQLFLEKGVLLYCPAAYRNEFQRAVSYIGRRIEDATGEDNFLNRFRTLRIGSELWEEQEILFSQSLNEMESLISDYRNKQDRTGEEEKKGDGFENESPTDFSLPQNRKWLNGIIDSAKKLKIEVIPLVIGGKNMGSSLNPSYNPTAPSIPLYRYATGNKEIADLALLEAKKGFSDLEKLKREEKIQLLDNTVKLLRKKRGELIAAMLLDSSKGVKECDREISRAIDGVKYIKRRLDRIGEFNDLKFQAKGVVLVVPSKTSFYLDAAVQISTALASGNSVIFISPPELVLSAWNLLSVFWEADFSKKNLQLFNCSDDVLESSFIHSKDIKVVFYSGRSRRARKWIRLNPELELSGNLDGKNTMIITSYADRDVAIRDLITSAFSFSGQNLAAPSLAILEEEVFEDSSFMAKLQDAAASLEIGDPKELDNMIHPIMHEPDDLLFKALTTLQNGEEWLLKPRVDSKNPNLYSPGIKLGVKEGSLFYQNIFQAPLLGVMKAKNLDHAIEIANALNYGLAGGLHSLDEREQSEWISKIEVGSKFINKTMIDAMIGCDPFGGNKRSCLGKCYKLGGPNYLLQGFDVQQVSIPKEKQPVNEWVNNLAAFLEKLDLSAEEIGIWYASIANYSFWWKKLKQLRDPAKVIGEDNILSYLPFKNITLRIEDKKNSFDNLRICAAALSCSTPLEISWDGERGEINWQELVPMLKVVLEDQESFLVRVKKGNIKRVRLAFAPNKRLIRAAALSGCYIDSDKVVSNGRYELLHYLQEASVSFTYHRDGSLGLRESEIRKPLL